MDIIGIIGGMSWQSTAHYLDLINQKVQSRLGGLHSARLRVATVDFAPIVQMQQEGNWAAAAEVLAEEARGLERAGAGFILIAANTMHKVFDEVQAAVKIPVLHLVDVTAEAVLGAGLNRIGLLATQYTMEQEFYVHRLAEHGVVAVVPGEEERVELQRIIYDELSAGQVVPSSHDRLLVMAQQLRADGAEGIVLGCTELELSLKPDQVEYPVFATTELHCEAAVNRALGTATTTQR